MLWTHFPEHFETWYKAPYKYAEELQKIAYELQIEGIRVSFPPETTQITITKNVVK